MNGYPEKRNLMGVFGNVWFHCFEMKKGERIPCHKHKHGHITLIGHGSVMALIDDKEAGVYKKGEAVPVPENTMHGYEALEDGTSLFCTLALRYTDGEVVEWEDALRIPHVDKYKDIKVLREKVGSDAWEIKDA